MIINDHPDKIIVRKWCSEIPGIGERPSQKVTMDVQLRSVAAAFKSVIFISLQTVQSVAVPSISCVV